MPSELKAEIEEIQGNNIERIEAACRNKTFVKQKFELPISYEPPTTDGLRLAVILRQADFHQWRNSQDYHEDLERFQAIDGIAEVKFGGLPEVKCYPGNLSDHCITYAGTTFRQQIEAAKGFDIAIGPNSSALDVYAAAGCLILREAVFQGYAPSTWLGGWNFNSFLGIAPNVELKIDKRQYKARKSNNLIRATQWACSDRLHAALKVVVDFARAAPYPLNTEKLMHKGFNAGWNEPQHIGKWLDSLRQPDR